LLISGLIVFAFFIAFVALLVMGSAYVFYRWRQATLFLSILVAILLILKIGISYQLVDIMTLIGVGIFGGWIFEKSRGATTFIVATVLTITVIHLVYIYVIDINSISSNMENVKSQLLLLLEKNDANKDVISQFVSVIDSGEWKHFVPFAIILKAFTYAVLGFFFVRILFEKLLQMTREGIEGYRLYEQFVFGIIIGLAGSYFFDGEQFPILKIVSIYVLFLFGGFYLVQGTAVIKYYMIKKNVQKYFLLILPIFVFPALMPILPVLGVMDIWVDYRKINMEKKSKDKDIDG